MLRYGVQKQVCLLTLEHVLKAGQPALMVQVMTEVSLSDGRILMVLGMLLYGAKEQTGILRNLYIVMKVYQRRTWILMIIIT